MSTAMKSPDDVVIVSAVRTPLCRSRKGGLAKVPPSTLLSTVFKATLDRTSIHGRDVEDICLGNCLMPPSGFAAMRMAHIVAGIPEQAPLSWINRQCSSGLQAVANIANSIATKQIQIGIGGGVESMSFYPMYVVVVVVVVIVLAFFLLIFALVFRSFVILFSFCHVILTLIIT